MQKKRIWLSPPHMSGNEMKYIQEAFSANWIAPLGPNVKRFEEQIKDKTETTKCVALASGTAGLHLALRALGIGEGDYVLTSTFTFVATANALLYENAIPVFVDSEMDTWNMDPELLEESIQKLQADGIQPKAIMLVHMVGMPAKMDEIMAIAEKYGLMVIEDCAESLGSTYKGKQTGSFGQVGAFSFNGNKLLTTSGGGAIVSNDESLADRILFLSTQAKNPDHAHYVHDEMGFNYRLSNILAGIGVAQMEVLDERISKRREIFEHYNAELGNMSGIKFQPEPEGFFSNRWLTSFTISNESVSAQDIIDALNADNIEARNVWNPMHIQPMFIGEYNTGRRYDSINGTSEFLFKNGVSLPSGSSMTQGDLDRVTNVIKEVLK